MNDWLHGKLSVPYNGDDPLAFYKDVVRPNRAYIHDVFMSVDFVAPGHIPPLNTTSLAAFKTISNVAPVAVTLNNVHVNYDRLVNTAAFDAVMLNASSVIVSNIVTAELINRTYGVDVCVSVNAQVDAVDAAKAWLNAGASTVNLTRRNFRNLTMAGEFHEVGLLVKSLVNEMCSIGCPYESIHLNQDVRPEKLVDVDYNPTCVPPVMIDELAGVVDVVKLAGRCESTAWIANCVAAYVDRRDVLVGDVVPFTDCWVVDFNAISKRPIADFTKRA